MIDDVAEIVGNEDFSEFSSGDDAYYVDKTNYLKSILGKKTKVFLFTRPRRFGKSLTISMIENFVGLNYENPKDKSKATSLFKDLEIFKDKAFVKQYLGNFPVISISLKGVSSLDSLNEALNNLGEKLSQLAIHIDDVSTKRNGIFKYFKVLDPRLSLVKNKLKKIKAFNEKNYRVHFSTL